MPNFNQLIMIGHLARDPELRYTGNGTAICQLVCCTNYSYVKDGQKHKQPCFLDWKAWGKTGENIAKFFKKGDAVMLIGRIDQETWEDKATGQKRSKHVGVVDKFEFVWCKKDE